MSDGASLRISAPAPAPCIQVSHQLIELVDDLVFAALDDPAEQLRDVHQRRTLVAELELDLADLARIFTTAVNVIALPTNQGRHKPRTHPTSQKQNHRFAV